MTNPEPIILPHTTIQILVRIPAAKIEKLLPSEWKKLNAKADTSLGDDVAKIVPVA